MQHFAIKGLFKLTHSQFEITIRSRAEFNRGCEMTHERIEVRVWGWHSSASVSRQGTLSDIIKYVDLGLNSGLDPDEIIDDIIATFPMFGDGELEVENGVACLVLVPVET